MYNSGRWRIVRRVVLAMAVVFVGIQFVPVDRTNPPVDTEVPASDAVREILRRSCYDCHSNQTVWPLYSRVAPVSWLVVNDVNEGRKEVNFSTWNRYTPEKQAKMLRECWEQVQEGEMPMWIYLPTHRDAVLSAEDKALLREWAIGNASGERDRDR